MFTSWDIFVISVGAILACHVHQMHNLCAIVHEQHQTLIRLKDELRDKRRRLVAIQAANKAMEIQTRRDRQAIALTNALARLYRVAIHVATTAQCPILPIETLVPTAAAEA